MSFKRYPKDEKPDKIAGILASVIKNSDLQQGIKKATLAKFWQKIVGKKFESMSKLHSINRNNVLTVACANSFVTSELTMFKADILKKLEPYAKSLDIKIEDITFSHKIWVEEKDEVIDYVEKHAPVIPDINYDEIELDEEETANIRRCIDNNKFASEEQRERMYEAIVKDLKFQKFMSENK